MPVHPVRLVPRRSVPKPSIWQVSVRFVRAVGCRFKQLALSIYTLCEPRGAEPPCSDVRFQGVLGIGGPASVDALPDRDQQGNSVGPIAGGCILASVASLRPGAAHVRRQLSF
jgi:hypothetical protein